MTVKRLAVRAVLDRMHAHCLTDNKVKIKKKNNNNNNNFVKNKTSENKIMNAI